MLGTCVVWRAYSSAMTLASGKIRVQLQLGFIYCFGVYMSLSCVNRLFPRYGVHAGEVLPNVQLCTSCS